jgi:hypothetical protein
LKPILTPTNSTIDSHNNDQSILHSMFTAFVSEEHKLNIPEFGVYLSEPVSNSDPTTSSPQFIVAKKMEIDGLVEKGPWKVCAKSELPAGANIMGGCFVLSIKDVGTPREVYKARYVVQGFRDRDKPYLVHQPMTARQQSTKLLVAMAAIFGFRIFTHDVQLAYLQSADKLMHDVYISVEGI